MSKITSESDPRGLISEAYNIDGIGPEECRSIFLDWALGFPSGVDLAPHIEALRAQFARPAPSHPMSVVLDAASETPLSTAGKRRGGRNRRSMN